MKNVNYLFLSLLLFFSFTICAQTPELVIDFQAGSEDGFNYFNHKGIILDEMLLLPAIDATLGEELGVVENGSFQLLKDINEGPNDSKPKGFVLMNGKVYFSAFDDTNGGAIWMTDGTAEGTELFYDPHPGANTSGIQPKGMVLSKSGHLYFTQDEELFRTDGTIDGTDKLAEGVRFYVEFNFDTPNYGLYQDGIAYTICDGHYTRLYAATDTVRLLGEVVIENNYTDCYGVSEVVEGLLFTLKNSFVPDVDGMFLYNSETETIAHFASPGADSHNPPLRVAAINAQRQLALIKNEGFYVFTGNPEDTELLVPYDISFSAGQTLQYLSIGDKLAFQTKEEEYGITDGTQAGTQVISDIDEEYPSNMILYNGKIYFATGVGNSSSTTIYEIDTTNYSAQELSTFSGPYGKKIRFIGGVEDRMYLLGELDIERGYELYSIPVTGPDAVIELSEESPYKVLLIPSKGIVKNEAVLNEKMNVAVYDVAGRHLNSFETQTNVWFDLPKQQGVGILVFRIGDRVFSKKYFLY